MRGVTGWLMIVGMVCGSVCGAEPEAPDYTRDVAPILTKYCAGCHKAVEPDGELSLQSYTGLQKGGSQGVVIVPGKGDESLLVRVLTGKSEPKMPPDDEPAPTADEIALLKRWINAGAPGPKAGEPQPSLLPKIASHTSTRPVSAIEVSPDAQTVAVARYQQVELRPVDSKAASSQESRTLGTFPGKVTALHFSLDGKQLITASGRAGLEGEAAIWNVDDGSLIRRFAGHNDILYDAELSPDGSTLATCSYDGSILLWNAATGESLQTLKGHNGAVYDVAFSPDSQFLVSASADDTCKVWRVKDGERLDTLGQPLKEQYTVSFSPDGKWIAAGGADNRIRVWQFISTDRPRINPIRIARFAHEGPVLKLAFTKDGKNLVSLAENRTLKIWETGGYTEVHLQSEPEVAAAMSLAGLPAVMAIGRLDGSVTVTRLPEQALRKVVSAIAPKPLPSVEIDPDETEKVAEQEPNNTPDKATPVDIPAVVQGAIAGRIDGEPDSDLYRFSARAGEEWVFEVVAARSKSPLDSCIEILDETGQPVPRVQLQAVRDSYFTFRGKNADEIGDFRVFNWEEMTLNQYLYANGEIVKLWMAPRGPDSGFLVYPGEGRRWGYFDSTPLSHALGAPCYIVEPHPPGTELIPNGLPVFTLNYENDDESTRQFGSDSKLHFTAPHDGNYLVRIRDVRGFEGTNFTYRMLMRPRKPDFRVSIDGDARKVPPGGQAEFRVAVNRMDDFDGPISVEVTGLPPGFEATSPVLVQAGQSHAFGVLTAQPDAPAPLPENQAISLAKGTAVVRGEEVSHIGKGLGKIELGPAPKLMTTILASQDGVKPVAAPEDGPLEFVLHPGETIMLRLKVDRKGHDGVVSFGKEDAGRNLPHGVIVDNIGLNGLLLLEEQTERDFFLSAADWVPEQSRLFHLRTGDGGGSVTQPVLLHIRRPDSAAPRTATR